MTKTTTTQATALCATCDEAITPNQVGGWFSPRRLAMGAGHRSVFCPDGVHVHRPSN